MPRFTREQLIKLQKRHKTDQAIAEIFGITRQAVHLLRAQYSIPRMCEKSKDRDREIYRLFKKGALGSELSRRFELSVSQCYRVIRKIQAKDSSPKS
jgi:hypothetical protein